MYSIILFSGIVLLGGCGAYEKRSCYTQGEECYHPENETETNDTTSGPRDTDGANGQDGTQGQPGATGPTGDTGAVGPAGKDGQDGATGAQGIPGSQGEAGADGSSCSVAQVSGGAIITCTDGTSAIILNGADGRDAAACMVVCDGQRGNAGYSKAIFRCPSSPDVELSNLKCEVEE